MRKFRIGRLKAQSILEYSVFIACFIAAVIVMQIYLKRGIQGRIKQISDDIGEQYAPKNTTVDITTKQDTQQVIISELVPLTDVNGSPLYENGLPMYGTKSDVYMDETVTRAGNEKLGALEKKLWD